MYKGLNVNANLPTNGLIPLVRRCRNHHSLAYQVPVANTDIYKSSFHHKTIRSPNCLISSAEGTADRVAKFTSAAKATGSGPGEWLSF